jgi:type VI secretion system VgrG family protein
MTIAPRFTLAIPNLPQYVFFVVSFEGSECLSKPYRFDITLASEEDDLDLFNKEAIFIIRGSMPKSLQSSIAGNIPQTIRSLDLQGPTAQYHGIVSEFEYIDTVNHHTLYRAILEPAVTKLGHARLSNVYLDEQTIPEIIARVLEDGGKQYGFTARYFEMQIYHEQDYRKRSFIHQHEESHLDFISRHMEREGMYYYFRQEQDREVMVITDDGISHKPPSKRFHYRDTELREGTIHNLTMKRTRVPASVTLNAYNFRKSTLDLTVTARVSEHGEGDMKMTENYRTPEEGKRYAQIRTEELLCREGIYTGKSTVVGPVSGELITIEGHPQRSFNRDYLVVDVTHSGSQARALSIQFGFHEKDDHYTNTFSIIPSDVQFRPECTTPVPVISGTMSAMIHADGSGKYPELDKHGRYKVRFPFKDNSNGKHWAWMRMATPYAGSDYGMHYPLRAGTEVMVSFMNGNLDMPVIAYAIPNSDNPSVVRDVNSWVNVLVRYGHTKEEKKGNWWDLIHGNEQKIVCGPSAHLHPGSKFTGCIGFNTNVCLGLTTHLNAGPVFNANMFSTVTYQGSDAITQGPGSTYTMNKSTETIGMKGIVLVGGVSGNSQHLAEARWGKTALVLSGLFAVGASAISPVISHFDSSPEKIIASIGVGVTSVIGLLSMVYCHKQKKRLSWLERDSPLTQGDRDVIKQSHHLTDDQLKEYIEQTLPHDDLLEKYLPYGDIPDDRGGGIIALNAKGTFIFGNKSIHAEGNPVLPGGRAYLTMRDDIIQAGVNRAGTNKTAWNQESDILKKKSTEMAINNSGFLLVARTEEPRPSGNSSIELGTRVIELVRPNCGIVMNYAGLHMCYLKDDIPRFGGSDVNKISIKHIEDNTTSRISCLKDQVKAESDNLLLEATRLIRIHGGEKVDIGCQSFLLNGDEIKVDPKKYLYLG